MTHNRKHDRSTGLLYISNVTVFVICSLNMRVSMDERRGENRRDKGIECCLELNKDMSLCRRLVKAAEDESESSTLTGALVVRSPVWFHLVSLAQGKFKKKKKKRKTAAEKVFSMSSS